MYPAGKENGFSAPPARRVAHRLELLVTRLQYELLRQGVSQRELARKARVNETSLSRICNGKEPAYPARGKRIAEALGWTGDPMALFEEVTE